MAIPTLREVILVVLRMAAGPWIGGLSSRLLAVVFRLLGPSTVAFVLVLSPALGQEDGDFVLVGGNVQRRVNGALALMAYSVVPDLAGSLLSIQDGSTDNPEVSAGQFGAGARMSTSFPVYLEGALGFSRYDPTFVASNGQVQREIPAKWTTIAGTIGVGWAFSLLPDWWLVPILNISLGHVESDASLAGRLIDRYTDAQIAFLERGRLNAYGLGGAVVLAYERYRERYDIDAQVRYTNILLQSFDTSSGAQGEANAATVSLYGRLRGPTGLTAMRRPVRYVLELSNSNYVGDQRGVLGFNYLSSAGLGLELDTSAIHLVIARVRYVFRYYFGENVTGFGGSIAVSF